MGFGIIDEVIGVILCGIAFLFFLIPIGHWESIVKSPETIEERILKAKMYWGNINNRKIIYYSEGYLFLSLSICLFFLAEDSLDIIFYILFHSFSILSIFLFAYLSYREYYNGLPLQQDASNQIIEK